MSYEWFNCQVQFISCFIIIFCVGIFVGRIHIFYCSMLEYCVRDSSGNTFFEERKKRLQRIARPLAAAAWGTPKNV